MMHFALGTVYFLFCLAIIYGAICDVQTYTIPNLVSYGLMGLFVCYAGLIYFNTPTMPHLGFYITPILFNVAYGLIVFIFFVVFWKIKWVGGGDVKFISAISFFMGLQDVLIFVVLLSALSVLMLAILKFIVFWNPYFRSGNLPGFLKNMLLKLEDKAIPYGLPAAIAALIVMPDVISQHY